jgi:rare lipoprotein A
MLLSAGIAASLLFLAQTSHVETGLASFYADKFNGRRTSSGERFSSTALTAAHRRLPFGTRLLVTRLDTGETVIVRVNDRGPFHRRRVVDLSRRAAEMLRMTRRGVASVRIERVADEPAMPTETSPDSPAVEWPIEDPVFPEETSR